MNKSKKRFKNMRTPFWKVVEGWVMIISGLIMIISFGLFHPDIWGRFMMWKLNKMFEEVK